MFTLVSSKIFRCLKKRAIETKRSVQRGMDPFASFVCQTADKYIKDQVLRGTGKS